jgi:hypothetical protein
LIARLHSSFGPLGSPAHLKDFGGAKDELWPAPRKVSRFEGRFRHRNETDRRGGAGSARNKSSQRCANRKLERRPVRYVDATGSRTPLFYKWKLSRRHGPSQRRACSLVKSTIERCVISASARMTCRHTGVYASWPTSGGASAIADWDGCWLEKAMRCIEFGSGGVGACVGDEVERPALIDAVR